MTATKLQTWIYNNAQLVQDNKWENIVRNLFEKQHNQVGIVKNKRGFKKKLIWNKE